MKFRTKKELKNLKDFINSKLKNSNVILTKEFRGTKKYGGVFYDKSKKTRLKVNDLEKLINLDKWDTLVLKKINNKN